MIAFGPDTDVSATPVQRVARHAMLIGCAVLGVGVISSVVRLSFTPVLADAGSPLRRVVQDEFSVMATGRATAASAIASARPAGAELLVGDTPGPATAGGSAFMLVTAYCPCPICCGKHASGLTASGKPTTANYGHFVAAPASLPFGSRVTVPGYNRGKPVPVYDRGGAIKGNRLDVFFQTHEKALAWGRRYVRVTVAGE